MDQLAWMLAIATPSQLGPLSPTYASVWVAVLIKQPRVVAVCSKRGRSTRGEQCTTSPGREVRHLRRRRRSANYTGQNARKSENSISLKYEKLATARTAGPLQGLARSISSEFSAFFDILSATFEFSAYIHAVEATLY